MSRHVPGSETLRTIIIDEADLFQTFHVGSNAFLVGVHIPQNDSKTIALGKSKNQVDFPLSAVAKCMNYSSAKDL
jgi:hypothetical protein